MIKEFILPPVRRIKVVIPKGMKVVNRGRSRLTSAANLKVTTAAVHEYSDACLHADTMLDRARKEGQLPIDSIPDLERVLTCGLWVDCDNLITGIELRGERGGGIIDYTLYISRDPCGDNHRWSVLFRLSHQPFRRNYQVLGLANK